MFSISLLSYGGHALNCSLNLFTVGALDPFVGRSHSNTEPRRNTGRTGGPASEEDQPSSSTYRDPNSCLNKTYAVYG